MGAPAAVLWRELLRLARRRHTWTLRGLYALLLLGMAAVILRRDVALADPALQARWAGQHLFGWHRLALVAVAGLLTPVLVASGIGEEREAGTLDLLTLTGAGAGGLLWSQVASRLLVLLGVILAGLPLLAFQTQFGGFGPMDVANAALSAALLAGVLAGFSAHCALLGHGPLGTLALCLPYALGVLLIPPLFAGFAGFGALALASPLWAAGADGPWLLATLPLWTGVVLQGWPLSVAVGRIVAAGGLREGESDLLSPAIWAVERFTRRTWGWAFAAALPTALLLGLSPWLGDAPRAALSWTSVALLAVLAHRLALLAVLALARWRAVWRTRPVRARQRAGASRSVWDLPILWRELRTAASGPTRWAPLPLTGLWLAWAAWRAPTMTDASDHLVGALWAAGGGLLLAGLLATASTVADRRQASYELLWLTRLGPRSLAAQKAAGVLVLAAPLLAAGTALYALAPAPLPGHAGHAHLFTEQNLLAGLPGLAPAGWFAWQLASAANLALATGCAAATTRSPSAAWPLALGAGLGWCLWPAFVVIAIELSPTRDASFEPLLAWYPFLDLDGLMCERGGLAPALLAATGLQLLLLPPLGLLYARLLQRPA